MWCEETCAPKKCNYMLPLLSPRCTCVCVNASAVVWVCVLLMSWVSAWVWVRARVRLLCSAKLCAEQSFDFATAYWKMMQVSPFPCFLMRKWATVSGVDGLEQRLGGEEGLHLKKPRNVAFKGLFLKVINLGILTERFPICNCLLMYTSAHIITK